ncbi:MAG: hypothetical protein COT74_11050 [Bdellovibrionales bacterium CG10_big_fil_rev_8_21_14_0_10_45_34]|nr:MAG: hypothetical protein COT74_11050 [Bdellovibrionales bacterium CG10_big_fil_rev_8_21_14_0_10_45_34]
MRSEEKFPFLIFAEAYFFRIWPMLVVYAILYYLGVLAGAERDVLKAAFFVLHAINALGLFYFLVKKVRAYILAGFFSNANSWAPGATFWVLILAILVLPGTYLEYPADPWEHLRRTFSWQTWDELKRNDIYLKWIYFFNWSLLPTEPLQLSKLHLSVLSALQQLLVLLSFGKLLESFGLDRNAQRVGVFAHLAFFGTSLFGLRYYALSPLPIALVALYSAMSLVVSSRSLSFGLIARIGLLCFLMIASHPLQEFLNFLLFLIGYSLFLLVKNQFNKNPMATARSLLLVVAVYILAALSFKIWAPVSWLEIRNHYHLNSIGGISAFSNTMRIGSTLGLFGFAGLVVSPMLIFIYPRLVVVALLPILTLLLPLFSFPAMKLLGPTGIHSVYRILYLFPLGVLSALAIYEITKYMIERKSFASRKVAASCVAIGLVAIGGLIYQKPFYGRLFFQVATTQSTDSLDYLGPVANWMQENEDLSRLRHGCRLMTDDVTYFYLSVFSGLTVPGPRLVPALYLHKLAKAESPKDFLRGYCGLLVCRRPELYRDTSNFMASSSNHWLAELESLPYYYPAEIDSVLDELRASGWTSKTLPANFEWWVPPQE